MTIPRQRSPHQAFHPPAHRRSWRTLWRRCACGHPTPCPSVSRRLIGAARHEARSGPPPTDDTVDTGLDLTRARHSAGDDAFTGPPGLSPDADARHGISPNAPGAHETETPHGWPRLPRPPEGPSPTPSPAQRPRPQTTFPHLSPPSFSPAYEEPDLFPWQRLQQPAPRSTRTRQRPNPQRAAPATHEPDHARHGTAPLLHRIHTHSTLDTGGDAPRDARICRPSEGPTTADAHTRPLTAVRPRDRDWVAPRTFPARHPEPQPATGPRPTAGFAPDEPTSAPYWNAPTMPLTQIGRAGGLTPAQAFRADRGPA